MPGSIIRPNPIPEKTIIVFMILTLCLSLYISYPNFTLFMLLILRLIKTCKGPIKIPKGPLKLVVWYMNAKFHENEPSRNGKITQSFIDIGKSCLSREFFTSLICLLMLFAKIKFSRKFPNLQYIFKLYAHEYAKYFLQSSHTRRPIRHFYPQADLESGQLTA